jgi:FkbM family methyltransferase
MEPDPNFLEVGRRNFSLNGRTGRFVHGAIGPEPGRTMQFVAESDGRAHEVAQLRLADLMRAASMSRVDLLLCDVQGAETAAMAQAHDLLSAGAVRFAVVSTHHHSISGDPLTHQKLLNYFTELGAHIVAEHSVGESFSGDGLIVAAFHPGDRDLTVDVSRAHQRDSLFGALEPDLAAEMTLRVQGESRIAELEREISAVSRGQRELAERVMAMEATKVWRWTRSPCSAYARLRARLSSAR